jgi:siroheme synthase-like protein
VFYPLFLDLNGRPVLVVGGGVVAERKVDSLLEAGASVTLVSPDVTPHLRALERAGSIRIVPREFIDADLEGKLLAISATDNAAVQEQVARDARARNVLINTVDQPALCDFIVPAVVRRGDVVLAISTSGKSPALAAALRAKFDGMITEDLARVAEVLGRARSEVHARFTDPGKRKEIFERIVNSGILDWIAECDDATALKRVRSIMEELG